MNWEQWIMVIVTAVIAPAVAWLVRQVLVLQQGVLTIATQVEERRVAHEALHARMNANCDRHQQWNAAHMQTLSRLDKNIVRLCEHAKVEYDS